MGNVKYEVIKEIASWDLPYNESLRLNYMKWEKNPPAYDIRRWKNGEPKRGVTIPEELLEELFVAMGEELGYEINNPDYDSSNHVEITPDDEAEEDNGKEIETIKEVLEDIDFRDFFVYGSYGFCRNSDHTDKERIRARVSIVKQYGGIGTIEFDATYCRKCGVYYISQSEYDKITGAGRVLCQLISEKKYNEKKSGKTPSDDLGVESVLYRFGYNVSEKDGYTDSYRQSILSAAIESGVIEKKKAIGHLKYLIRLNEKNPLFSKARDKWSRDIAYLSGVDYSDKKIRLVGVKRIIK